MLVTLSLDCQLRFKRGKCNVMHFGKHKPRQVNTIDGQQLEVSNQEKDLVLALVDYALGTIC